VKAERQEVGILRLADKRLGLLINFNVSLRLIDDNLARREDNSLKVFQLLTLELWHRAFIDGVA